MTDEKLPEEVTKSSFRYKVWNYMTKNELVNFPLSIFNRIPNFKGAAEAAQRVTQLEEFKKAKVIKINPDKPQEPMRFLALEAGKEILVPIPRLKSGLFLHVTPIPGTSKSALRKFSTMHGLSQIGKPVGVESKIKVDLVVLGSVCVSRDGYRLGKGEGFADLEFAMMIQMGAVTEDVVVITTVHDCQVVDNLPAQLFKEYDVPVDVIVTPTQTIIVKERLKKPNGIIWGLLSQRRLNSMPVLRHLKEMDEKDGKVVTLKETDSDTETRQYYRKHINHVRSRKRSSNEQQMGKTEVMEEERKKNDQMSTAGRKSSRRIRNEGNTDFYFQQNQMKISKTMKMLPQGREKGLNKNSKSKKGYGSFMKSNIDFSLKLSNISNGVRVRDLKNALIERGVKPNEITWQGYHGICYLHFNKLRNENTLSNQPIQIDSIVANLQQLRIGDPTNKDDDYIIVEPAKPISRIEVTDVTAV